jgi:hypothetical protein
VKKVYTWDYKNALSSVVDILNVTYDTLDGAKKDIITVGKQDKKLEMYLYEITIKPIALYKGSKKIIEKKARKKK